ncbi:SRPBCC family protein [Nitratireductor soli]|uniref:SRPBCC family protein n=1 Tax=Nitratireductor soli TaxID=1670619 RepID=UPI00065DEB97|nr:SRPBCC family protein [Nitratireductor soli]
MTVTASASDETPPPVDPRRDAVHERHVRNGRVDPAAPVQASGEITIAAPPDKVWSVLSDVGNWPSIRSDIHDVEGGRKAAPDAVFVWSTAGVRLTSKFGVVEPGRLLTWSTSVPGLVMAHEYRFEPDGTGGTRIVCRESMWAPVAAPQIDDDELRSRIRSWLEGIKAFAERR